MTPLWAAFPSWNAISPKSLSNVTGTAPSDSAVASTASSAAPGDNTATHATSCPA